MWKRKHPYTRLHTRSEDGDHEKWKRRRMMRRSRRRRTEEGGGGREREGGGGGGGVHCLCVFCVVYGSKVLCASANECVISAMPRVLSDSEWLLIFSFVGSHSVWEWEERSECEACKPCWYNWMCHECGMSVPQQWTRQKHRGQCGHSCPCCRWLEGSEDTIDHCELCEDLWVLKTVSRSMRLALGSYNGL